MVLILHVVKKKSVDVVAIQFANPLSSGCSGIVVRDIAVAGKLCPVG